MGTEGISAALPGSAGREWGRCVGRPKPTQSGTLCEGSTAAPGTGEELCGAAGAGVSEQLGAPGCRLQEVSQEPSDR